MAATPITALTPSQASEFAHKRADIAELLLEDSRIDISKLSIVDIKESKEWALLKDALQTIDRMMESGDSWGNFEDIQLDEIPHENLRLRESVEGHRANMIARSAATITENITPTPKRGILSRLFGRKR